MLGKRDNTIKLQLVLSGTYSTTEYAQEVLIISSNQKRNRNAIEVEMQLTRQEHASSLQVHGVNMKTGQRNFVE
jgi:hypothetical protein